MCKLTALPCRRQRVKIAARVMEQQDEGRDGALYGGKAPPCCRQLS